MSLDFPKPAIIIPAPKELLKPSHKLIVPSNNGPLLALLPGMYPFPSRAVTPIDIEFGSTDSSTSNTNSYTFNSMVIGAADDGRRVAVCIMGSDSATNFSVSSVTVGGVDATLVPGTATLSSAGTYRGEIWITDTAVATGTTANVVITWSESIITCMAATYRLLNLGGTIPFDVATDSGDFLQEYTLDVPAGGGVIGNAGLRSIDLNSDSNWTELTEDSDAFASEASDPDCNLSTASAMYATAQTGLDVSCQWGASPGASTSSHGSVISLSGS